MSDQTIEKVDPQFRDGQIAAIRLLGRINVAIRRDGRWLVARGQYCPEPETLSDQEIAVDGQILDIPAAWGLPPDAMVVAGRPGGGQVVPGTDAWDVHQEQI